MIIERDRDKDREREREGQRQRERDKEAARSFMLKQTEGKQPSCN